MAIRIYVDRDKCQGYGQCTYEAPDVFQLDDAGVLQYREEVDDESARDVENAADVCPMQAITIE